MGVGVFSPGLKRHKRFKLRGAKLHLGGERLGDSRDIKTRSNTPSSVRSPLHRYAGVPEESPHHQGRPPQCPRRRTPSDGLSSQLRSSVSGQYASASGCD
jgi:hypothetical protein